MHTDTPTTPSQWPLWIRVALPVITPVLKGIGVATDARDRFRSTMAARSFDHDNFAPAWLAAPGSSVTGQPGPVERGEFVGATHVL